MEWKRQQDPLQMSCHTPQVNPILPLWYTNQLHQLQHWGNCHFFSDPFHHLSFVHYSAKLVNLNSVCGLHPMAISIQYTHENPWRGKSLPLVEFITQSVSAKEEARCNLFNFRPSFPSEPQRAIDIQPPTPAFSPTSKFRHHMLGRWLSATQFKQGLEPPLLLACVFINISRLSMGPEIPGNWEQFGLCYLKWLHFL